MKLTLEKHPYLGVPVSAACVSTRWTCGELVLLTHWSDWERFTADESSTFFYPFFIVSASLFSPPPLLPSFSFVVFFLEDHTSFPVWLFDILLAAPPSLFSFWKFSYWFYTLFIVNISLLWQPTYTLFFLNFDLWFTVTLSIRTQSLAQLLQCNVTQLT